MHMNLLKVTFFNICKCTQYLHTVLVEQFAVLCNFFYRKVFCIKFEYLTQPRWGVGYLVANPVPSNHERIH